MANSHGTLYGKGGVKTRTTDMLAFENKQAQHPTVNKPHRQTKPRKRK